MQTKNLQAHLFEMMLATFGVAACGTGTTTSAKPNLPVATEAATHTTATGNEASCSAAGCGAKATDGDKAVSTAAPTTESAKTATESDPPPPTLAADSKETLADVPPATPTPTAASVTPAKSKPAHAKRVKHVSKSADDDGCGAGSCSSAK